MRLKDMVARKLATLIFLASTALTACSETPPGVEEGQILITVEVNTSTCSKPGNYTEEITLTITDKETPEGPTGYFVETIKPTCAGNLCTATFGADENNLIPPELPQEIVGFLKYDGTVLSIPVKTDTIKLVPPSCNGGSNSTTDTNATETDTMSGSMSDSESATDSTPTGTATDSTTDSGTGTMSATDTDGTISGSGTDSNTDSNGTDTDSGTDSMGTDSGTMSGTDSMGTDSGTDSNTDSNGTTMGTDSMGTDSDTMSGTDSTSMSGTDSDSTTGSTSDTDSTTGSTTDSTTGSTGDTDTDTDSTTGNPVVDPFTPCHRPLWFVPDNKLGNKLEEFGTNRLSINVGNVMGRQMGDQCLALDMLQVDSLKCILSPSLLANGTFTLMGLTVKLALPGNIPNNTVLVGTMSCTSNGGYNGAFVLNAQAINGPVA